MFIVVEFSLVSAIFTFIGPLRLHPQIQMGRDTVAANTKAQDFSFRSVKICALTDRKDFMCLEGVLFE